MDKVVTVSKSFDEADRADKAYYRSLTPQERLQILLELNSRWPTDDHAEASERRSCPQLIAGRVSHSWSDQT
jgi:hypothetical protein